MTERGEGDPGMSGEPPAPPEPFDPSTREFPAVERETKRIEQRHEAVSMDTSTFQAIPAPTPPTTFVPRSSASSAAGSGARRPSSP